VSGFVRSLHFDQAPPLAIPLSFFLTAPVALACAGALLLYAGAEALVTPWLPLTIGLTHLGTLGFLGMVMIGALYQLTAVLSGNPVPAVRLAHAVHAIFVVGVAGLCTGIAGIEPRLVFWSVAALFLSLGGFVVPVAMALLRAPTHNQTVRGMRLALASLVVAVAIGLWIAHGHAGMGFPGARSLWIQVHVSVALIGWVGGLISSVSWQVLPMFYMSNRMNPRLQRALRLSIVLLIVLPATIVLVDYAVGVGGTSRLPARLAALGSLPALVIVWGVHPLATLHALRTRRRKRRDASALFWQTGLACAPLVACAGVAAWWWPEPRLALLFGWLALFGWAGMIVHGMLTRIVPFLVWFHRFAPLAGTQPTPSARGLLPDPWARRAFGLHAATLLLGCIAIVVGGDVLVRGLGVALLGVAATLSHTLVRVALRRPAPVPSDARRGPFEDGV
jgi:hypothetical protein